MNVRIHAPTLTAILLALSAGAAAPAVAQSSDIPARQTAAADAAVDFRSCHWLSDRKVVNNNGEEIADVSDLILDRGAGRIEYVVVKTGTTFGMGGKSIAIPYDSFDWETGSKDRFVLASTAEQLKQFPEYTPEGWKAMKEFKKDDKNALREHFASGAPSPSDPYAGSLDTAKPMRVEGEITSVERVRTSTYGEQVQITVKSADGTSKKIALGPSWYINGTSAPPMRGDKVVVDTLALPRDPDQLLAGTHLKSGDHSLHLRETDGSPAWSLKSVESGGQTYSTPYSRYLVLSDLTGMKVDCRGNETGTVNDVILDRNSGEIAFLSIDPNQNFLGISDTKRLIPWSVATVMLDGTMRIDASKEMVLASPETPSDLSTLNTGPVGDRAYKAFGVPARRMETRRPISSAHYDSNNAWAAHGPIIRTLEPASTKTFEGKVIDISEVTFEKGVQPARAVKVRLAADGGGDEVILLGPSWYMENQKDICHTGDMVKVEASRATIDGRQHWLARSVDCKDSRVVLLDDHNSPAWPQR